MAQHVGIKEGVLYPQPDYTISVDQDDKWTITQVYLCESGSAVQLMPRAGSTHPQMTFCTMSKAEAKVTEGDIAEITATYVGVAPKKDDEDPKANATYSMGLALSEEPLLSHHRYAELSKKEIAALQLIISGKDKDDQGNKQRDTITSDKGLEALAKIERGETTYYNPKITWRASWTSDKPATAADLNGIGKIDNTPLGPCPALAGGRTWLFNGMTQTQEGKSFKLEVEWLASNRGGWDTDLYKD